MKKIVSLVLALIMLLGMAVSVAAEDVPVIEERVLHSIAEEEENGYSLAFAITVNAAGVKVKNGNYFDNSTATVEHNGETVKLVKMGVVATTNASIGENMDQMVLGASATLNIEALRLYHLEDTLCRFAVRITGIPAANRDVNIYVRPYYVIEADGVQETVYAAAADHSSYLGTWSKYQDEVVLPAIGSDIDVTKKKNRIRVEKASYDYKLDDAGEDILVAVSFTFRNYSTNWITEETDYVKYTYYDMDGKSLGTGILYIGCIDTKTNKFKNFTFDLPLGTAKVALTSSKITYWTEWA